MRDDWALVTGAGAKAAAEPAKATVRAATVFMVMESKTTRNENIQTCWIDSVWLRIYRHMQERTPRSGSMY